MLNRYSCSGRGCAIIPRGNSIAFVHVCAVGVNFNAFRLFFGDSATAFSSSLKEIEDFERSIKSITVFVTD